MKKQEAYPPKLPIHFFRWFCHPKLVIHIEGDLLEVYGKRVKEKGKWKADLKFWLDVLLLFRPSIIRPMEGYKNLNSFGMFKNYLTIAGRVMARNKVETAINALGLMLGMVSVFLIMLYVRYETGYDTFYPESQNLYRVAWETDNPQTRTPHPMAQAMAHDFPEVQSAVSLTPLWGSGLTRETFSFRNPLNDAQFTEANILAVDTTFFDVFGFSVVRGDARKALKNTNTILLSESAADKYFGNEDPIGKQLLVFPDSVLLQVEAVFKDVPAQAHFHFDFLISYVREKSLEPEDAFYSWADFGHYNYVRLQPGTDIKSLESKLLPWLGKYIPNSDEKIRAAQASGITFRLQPVTDIHLKSHLRWELEPNGNMEYVYIMGAVALLTLLIACINFMNLMTAKSTERAKEIGIRKTMGALRQQLSAQFLSESVLMALVSVVLAALVVQGLLPFYREFTGQSVQLNYEDVLLGLGIIGLLVGLASGVYPAWIISKIQPQSILKGKFKTSGRGVRLRNSLIVFQFAISMILISGAIIIYNQLNFIQQKNLGFSKEAVLVVPIRTDELNEKIETLKTELLTVNGVSAVSASSNMPGGGFNQNTISLIDKPDNEISCSEMFVDYDFNKTMNLSLADGRFFQQTDTQNNLPHFILNETAARQLNVENLIGKEINWHAYDEDRPVRGRVVGIVHDFNFQSLHEPLRPLLLVLYPAYNHLVVKLTTENLNESIADIKQVYNLFETNFAFEFSSLDDQLNKQYALDKQTATMFSGFAGLTILIACFGLFAMAMLTFQQRTKEVSVHKVLGASSINLIVLLMRDFTKLILLAILLAVPIAWWLMDRWFNNFIYQVGIGPEIFVVSGMVLLGLAWITLIYLTLRTTRLNPAETLKG